MTDKAEEKEDESVTMDFVGESAEALGLRDTFNRMPADRKIELRGILEGAYGRRLTDGEKRVVVYMYLQGR